MLRKSSNRGTVKYGMAARTIHRVNPAVALRWAYKWQLNLAAETVSEDAFSSPQAIHWAASRSMPSIIMAEPEDFPGAVEAELLQNLRLLMRVELTPGTIDLGGRVDRMCAEALIGFGDVLVALLTDAVHPGSLLSETFPRRPVRLQ
jgi:hypothetical protein